MFQKAMFLFVMLALPHAALAEPCEELTDVNDGWTKVMDKVSKYEEGEPFDYEERRDLSAVIVHQYDGSEALPWSFEDAGDERGGRLARTLLEGVKSTYRPLGEFHENDEALAESLKDIAEALEALDEYCAQK